jgi:protein-S-isoprenylcysteine O-methyltransferase Ste14
MKNKFLLPPNLFYASIVLIVVLYFIFRQFNLVKFPYNTVGFVLVAIGVGLNIIAWQQFVKAGTPEKFEKSKKLVVNGLYKYSRNPMYVGAVLILIGLVLLLGNVLAFVSPILFFLAIDKIVIAIEEEKTTNDLGEKYLKYKRKVRKWI